MARQINSKVATHLEERNPLSAQNIGEAEADAMFEYFRTVRRKGGKKEVARKFGRSRPAVMKVAKRERWKERLEKIRDDVKKAADKKFVKEEITNLKLIRKAKKFVAAKVFNDKKAKATMFELMQLVRLEEELLQNLPTPGSGNSVVNIVNDNSELARILANAQLGLAAIKAKDSSRFSTL